MRSVKITAYIIVMMLMVSLFLPVGQASAAPALEVSAKAGINGKAKHMQPAPLYVTIKNTGDDFNGDMVVNASYSYEAATALVIPISIANGEEKTFELYLNGLTNYGYSEEEMFAFFEGGIDKGKKVKYSGTKRLQTNFLDPMTTFIFTVTDSSDRLSEYLKLSQHLPHAQLEVIHLNQIKEYTLPEDPLGLAMANIIAFDEVSIADLSQKQQEALLKWVQDGGTLVIGAMEQINTASGIFKDSLPLTLSNEMETVSAERLSALINEEKFSESIQVHAATMNAGSLSVLADEGNILAASKKIGSGEIIQTAFSLGDQPLASMEGYAALTAKMLSIQKFSNFNMGGYHQSPFEQMMYDIRSVNELFPSFEVSMTFTLIVVIIYIIVIGPILYFILKRLDKREYAWWMIPLISIVVSIALFVIGAQGRIMQPQAQQSAIYKVNEDSSLNGYYIESILTNRGGDFIVNTDSNTTAMALRNYGRFTGSGGALYEHSYIKEHADGTTLTLRDLSYWSVQSFIGNTATQNVGKMDIDLTLKNEKLTGTIKNNFPFDLKDVTLQSGLKIVKLGDIEANGTLTVAQDVKLTTLQKPVYYNRYNYTYPTTKADIDPVRIERLQAMTGSLTEQEEQPIISAWAEQALVGVELESGANMSPISYFVQPFEGKVELTGPFTMKQSNLNYDLIPLSVNGYYEPFDRQLNKWYLSDGSYEVIVSVPPNFTEHIEQLNELIIANKDSVNMKLAIWNNHTESYEPLDKNRVELTNDVENYMNDLGEIRLELIFTTNQGTIETTLPNVELKGVAK
ncbi:DUF7408 domain-containing protein [Metasolibacillus meyeri]|uniref:DUF7408 domain-containing protein n=1 Tax=Metasolibacillus meyeri TaxID=1071052 RepID=UPI000D31B1E1|nr:hypothetical protein [Metasolibacillus meyeri]